MSVPSGQRDGRGALLRLPLKQTSRPRVLSRSGGARLRQCLVEEIHNHNVVYAIKLVLCLARTSRRNHGAHYRGVV